jgi:FkbM family methyltransferase
MRRRIEPAVRNVRTAIKMLAHKEWRRGLMAGVGATLEHDSLSLRSDFRTVIDVGAGTGQFALYSRVRFPDALIYAIEPLRDPRARLDRLFGDDARVRVIPLAAASAPGSASMNVTRNHAMSSLLPVTELHATRFSGGDATGQEDIVMDTLDSMFSGADLVRPVLLKLDVQGFELEALRGAPELLRHVDCVLAECCFVPFYEGQPLFEDVVCFLKDAGFGIVSGSVTFKSGRAWQEGDFVFERRPPRL